jgi:proteasome accessory factor A
MVTPQRVGVAVELRSQLDASDSRTSDFPQVAAVGPDLAKRVAALNDSFRQASPTDLVSGAELTAEVRRVPLSRRVYGIETEYGVAVSGRVGASPTVEDVVKDLYARSPARRILTEATNANVRAQAFLPNGSRFYVDVGNHPEYATPECDSVLDTVAADLAGEIIVAEAAAAESIRLSTKLRRPIGVRMIKNNRDGRQSMQAADRPAGSPTGAEETFGCHENYLSLRSVPNPELVAGLLPHFVTRQLYAGSGSLRVVRGEAKFGMSQRAEHMFEVEGNATTRSRPIFNTRDEAHADQQKYRRLHVIVGDANRSQTATYLKLGTTGLVLRVIEDGTIPLGDLVITQPVGAIRAVSSDLSGTAMLAMASGRQMSALDIQEAYIERVRVMGDRWGLSPAEVDIIDRWQLAVDDLRVDRNRQLGKIDWVFKLQMLEQRADRLGVPIEDPKVTMLDFLYHDVDRRAIFTQFESQGSIDQLVDDALVQQYLTSAPASSRAGLRGQLIGAALQRGLHFNANWDNVVVNPGRPEALTFAMSDPFASRDQRAEDWIRRGFPSSAA